ncbi:uncharacterized protein LOC125500663 isoform X1 [Athalia rosae]|uniref:uncharacterized protein LOC125500663 isoform X1 n=1 Tax=Athalia rosae TaxID=37344 RepID=UPI00203421FE|nr:uncharacterized protein LOC125500663 isoform X1 [Athalia rosae]
MRSSFRLRRDPHHSTPHNISGEKKSPHHEALAKFTRRGSRRRRAASGCTIRSVGVHGEEYDEETTKNTPDRWRWECKSANEKFVAYSTLKNRRCFQRRQIVLFYCTFTSNTCASALDTSAGGKVFANTRGSKENEKN